MFNYYLRHFWTGCQSKCFKLIKHLYKSKQKFFCNPTKMMLVFTPTHWIVWRKILCEIIIILKYYILFVRFVIQASLKISAMSLDKLIMFLVFLRISYTLLLCAYCWRVYCIGSRLAWIFGLENIGE